MKNSRRSFVKKSVLGAAGFAFGASSLSLSAKSYNSILGANDRIAVSVIGIRGFGQKHLRNFAGMAESKNVRVKTICDVDERLWAERVDMVEQLQGMKPGTEFDLRKVFDDKDIDAISIATPNHWHALATIWALQAGKHVYVEKPCSHNIFEGRKMIEAMDKYGKLVQAGFHNHSINNVRQAMQFLHSGGIGEVYMAKGLCYKPRDSFGIAPNSEPPKGLHYDLWLGPASEKPYNEKQLHYNWHWHWDTGNGDIGNQGVHQLDIARWGLNKMEHPVKISSSGGYFKFTKEECSQETPNTQNATLEYADGKIIEFEVRGLYTGGESDLKVGNLFYGTEGWMRLERDSWQTFFGRDNEPGPSSESISAGTIDIENFVAMNGNEYENFIETIRSGNPKELACPLEEGFYSSALPILSNIAYRQGRSLQFDGASEKFVADSIADQMLTREYRNPFVVPKRV